MQPLSPSNPRYPCFARWKSRFTCGSLRSVPFGRLALCGHEGLWCRKSTFLEFAMFREIFFAVSIIAATSAFAADKSDGVLSSTVQWRMSLDAEGHITALEPNGKPIDALRQKLEPTIRNWEFVPGTVDGRPARTDTLLSVQVALTAMAGSDQLSVTIEDVRTGGFVAGNRKPPRFPPAEATRLINGSGFASVVFEVSYDLDGKVEEVTPIASSPAMKGRFKEYAETAVRSWRYEPERVAGIGVPGKVVVPLCFSVGSNRTSAQRAAEKCQWTQPGSKASVDQGQSLALDSSVTLKSDVIGSTL
ncbi:MAG: energy transducer TonB [Xanthomonadales bacterium]|nr:energy transducer TonB [Xanthomonadales bacterium]